MALRLNPYNRRVEGCNRSNKRRSVKEIFERDFTRKIVSRQ
jgi:hypothetical protein